MDAHIVAHGGADVHAHTTALMEPGTFKAKGNTVVLTGPTVQATCTHLPKLVVKTPCALEGQDYADSFLLARCHSI